MLLKFITAITAMSVLVLVTYLVASSNTTGNKGITVATKAFGEGSHIVNSNKFKPAVMKKAEIKKVNLREANTVTFRNEVNAKTVAALQKEMLAKDKKLPPGEPIYLVLDTPGGSIPDGFHLVSTVQGMTHEVKTITIYAASMGFYLAQALGERLVLTSGTYMAHRARVGGIGGEVGGNFETRVNSILELVTLMEKTNAKRLGVDLDTYKANTRDEYYVIGEEAIAQGVADNIAAITCDKSLDGVSKEEFAYGFFTVVVTYSKCPAITGYLSVAVAGSTLVPEKTRAEIENFLSRSRPLN